MKSATKKSKAEIQRERTILLLGNNSPSTTTTFLTIAKNNIAAFTTSFGGDSGGSNSNVNEKNVVLSEQQKNNFADGDNNAEEESILLTTTTQNNDDEQQQQHIGMRKKMYKQDEEEEIIDDNDDDDDDDNHKSVVMHHGNSLLMILIAVSVIIILLGIAIACIAAIYSYLSTQQAIRRHWNCPPLDLDFSKNDNSIIVTTNHFCGSNIGGFRIIRTHCQKCDRLDISHTELVCDFIDSSEQQIITKKVPESGCFDCQCWKNNDTNNTNVSFLVTSDDIKDTATLSIVIRKTTTITPQKCRLFFRTSSPFVLPSQK